MGRETKEQFSNHHLRRRLASTLKRIRQHGFDEDPESEAGDMHELIQLLFRNGTNAGNKRALDAMDEQLKEAEL